MVYFCVPKPSDLWLLLVPVLAFWKEIHAVQNEFNVIGVLMTSGILKREAVHYDNSNVLPKVVEESIK